jgi:hypothetical protein
MMSTKEAIFFNIVYIQADSQNTVFISMKYRLHLIYLSLGLSYFLSNVKYVLKASGGGSFSALFIGILKRIWKI